jgi:hypothetical protein
VCGLETSKTEEAKTLKWVVKASKRRRRMTIKASDYHDDEIAVTKMVREHERINEIEVPGKYFRPIFSPPHRHVFGFI